MLKPCLRKEHITSIGLKPWLEKENPSINGNFETFEKI
jgi:hypothetical protein